MKKKTTQIYNVVFRSYECEVMCAIKCVIFQRFHPEVHPKPVLMSSAERGRCRAAAVGYTQSENSSPGTALRRITNKSKSSCKVNVCEEYRFEAFDRKLTLPFVNSYTKVVVKGMTKAEMILKVVMSTADSPRAFVDQFRKLLPDSDMQELRKVLEMKVSCVVEDCPDYRVITTDSCRLEILFQLGKW